MQSFLTGPEDGAVPIWLATESACAGLLQSLPPQQAVWAQAQGFTAERHRLQLLPDGAGAIAGVLLGLGPVTGVQECSLWEAAFLAERLPAATYRLANPLSAPMATQFALGWLLGSYRLTHYRGTTPKAAAAPGLVAPAGADLRYAQVTAQAMGWARDLINAPANQLGPEELTRDALDLVAQHSGEGLVYSGETLAREYPLIAAVGGARAPPTTDRLSLASSQQPTRHARGQRRVLRQRGPGYQACNGHAAHEEGYGRRCLRARARAHAA
jgi:leucyl aminopeptidase